MEQRLRAIFGTSPVEPNHQIQVLGSLFYRNKSAYIIGKGINGNREYPFVVPIMHNRKGELGDVAKLNCNTCHQGAYKPLFGAPMAKDFPELTPPPSGKPAQVAAK